MLHWTITRRFVFPWLLDCSSRVVFLIRYLFPGKMHAVPRKVQFFRLQEQTVRAMALNNWFMVWNLYLLNHGSDAMDRFTEHSGNPKFLSSFANSRVHNNHELKKKKHQQQQHMNKQKQNKKERKKERSPWHHDIKKNYLITVFQLQLFYSKLLWGLWPQKPPIKCIYK